MNTIWIEIPVTDLDRAAAFYSAVFGHESPDALSDGDRTIVIIPGTPTVALNRATDFVPSLLGSLPYFHVDDLDAAIETTIAHGGTLIEAKNERPGHGWFAEVSDSEGNAFYLHGAD